MQLQTKLVPGRSIGDRRTIDPPTPRRGIQPVSKTPSIKEHSAKLEELMHSAVLASKCKDVAAFKRLPADEQNAFLAQARGLAANPMRDGVQLYDPATIERSPFNREIGREEPETLELVASIKERGVLQNGIIRPVPPNPAKPGIKWQLIAGERRWLSATIAGVLFPAAVRDVGDIEAMEIQGEENFQRKNLNPMEEARTFQQLRDAHLATGASKTEAIARIAERLKRSEAIIYERLTLLELPEKARALVSTGRLPASHAALLPKIHDPKTVETLAATIANAPGKAPMPFKETQRLVEQAEEREANLAQWQRLRGEYEAKGWKVLSDPENRKVFPHADSYHGPSGEEFVTGDDTRTFSGGRYLTWTKAMGKHAPNPVLGRAGDGTPIVLFAVREAMAAVEMNTPRSTGSNGATSPKPNAEKVKAAKKRDHAKARRAAWTTILKELVAAVEQKGDSETFLRVIAQKLTFRITSSSERARQVVDRRGLREDNQERNEAILKRQVEDCFNAKQLRGIIIEALAWDYVPYDFGAEAKWQAGLVELCARFGVDWARIENQVQASGNAVQASPAAAKKALRPTLTVEARKRLAAAMKARWQAQRKARAAKGKGKK